MRRLITGILLATLALYLWGMIYWGVNPLPYTAWHRTTDDAAAGAALLQYFPETGTYYLPGLYNDEETLARLNEQGPVAFIHLTAREGRPQHDIAVMIKGFVLNLVVVALLAALFKSAVTGQASYGRYLKIATLAGLTATVLTDLGDVVWWYLPLDWKLHQALYTLSAWLVPALVLPRFVRDEG